MDDLRRGGDKGYKHLRATAKNYAIKDLFYCCWHYMPGYNLKFQVRTRAMLNSMINLPVEMSIIH